MQFCVVIVILVSSSTLAIDTKSEEQVSTEAYVPLHQGLNSNKNRSARSWNTPRHVPSSIVSHGSSQDASTSSVSTSHGTSETLINPVAVVKPETVVIPSVKPNKPDFPCYNGPYSGGYPGYGGYPGFPGGYFGYQGHPNSYQNYQNGFSNGWGYQGSSPSYSSGGYSGYPFGFHGGSYPNYNNWNYPGFSSSVGSQGTQGYYGYQGSSIHSGYPGHGQCSCQHK